MRGPKGRQRGAVGQGAASLPPHQLLRLGGAVISPWSPVVVLCGAPAAVSFYKVCTVAGMLCGTYVNWD